MGRERVVVIGGGIVGCTAAALLAEAGRSVTLVEATAIAAGASGRNSGAIQHPFDPILLPLHLETLAMYRELAAADLGFAFPSEPVGILLLTDDADAARSRAAELGAAFPELNAEALDPDAVAAAEPALSPGWAAVRLATGFPATSDGATRALAARAVRAGVTLRIGLAARPWLDGGHLRGVTLDDGEHLPADQVLVAGGPWTPEVLGREPAWPAITRTWGVTVQVQLASAPRHVLEEGVVHTVNVPRGQSGSLFSLIAVGELATVGSIFLTDEPDPEVVAPELVHRGSAFVPALADAPIIGIRLCARPQSQDGRPFIGPVPGVDGLFVCAGHGPWGISSGPGSAALVVDLMLGRADRIPAALRSDRAPGVV
ncbi:MAG: NAD(P)/FAD-dependent oxidoreductase [Candidatus Limnocylindria bacterium]